MICCSCNVGVNGLNNGAVVLSLVLQVDIVVLVLLYLVMPVAVHACAVWLSEWVACVFGLVQTVCVCVLQVACTDLLAWYVTK